jgi:hypothetical protein
MAGFYWHANDSAAARFDDVAPDDSVGRPVGAFNENIWLESLDQIVRCGLVENHHTIHACQRFENLRALGLGGNGTSGSLDLPDGPIRVQTDDQGIPQRPRLLEVSQMTDVQEVEHAVGEHDGSSGCPQALDNGNGSGSREHRAFGIQARGFLNWTVGENVH